MTCAHCWRISANILIKFALAETCGKKSVHIFWGKKSFFGCHDMLTIDRVCRKGNYGQGNTFKDLSGRV